MSFSALYHGLPRAMSVPVGWQNPLTGQFEETDRFQALVDPGKVEMYTAYSGDDAEEYDPLYYVPTNDYAVVNPVDFYEPLEEVLMENESTDIFGRASLDRNGGRCFIDIMFSGEDTSVPEEATDSLVTGLHTGYSHLGDISCFAEGFAQDGSCKNTMRGLTEKFSRKHVGDARDDVQWWETVLESYGAFPDHLADVIRAALDVELSIQDFPFDTWTDFFQLAGFPEYLAQGASSHATSRSDDPWEVTAWDLYSGSTYSLTHVFNGNLNSDTYRRHMGTANDILMNPAQVIESVRVQHERMLQEAGEEEELIVAEEQFEEIEETIEQRKEEYHSRRETMDSLFTELEEVEG
jgi:hypothetical protein